MRKIFEIFAITVNLFSVPAFGAEFDPKSMVGTFVFESKKVNEAKAIQIAGELSENKEIQRILVRQFKDADTWAMDLELKHDGSKESFNKAVSKIENSIEKHFGKDTIQSKYVASSVTWIKK